MLQPKRPARTRTEPARNPDLSEQLAARAPHFKSFAHITDPRARRAKEVEQFLLFAAEAIPELAADLQPLINDAHARGNSAAPSARAQILVAFDRALPPATIEEFMEDLRLPYGTVYENLMKLVEVGLVELRTRPREVEPAGKRGGARKPELVFTRRP